MSAEVTVADRARYRLRTRLSGSAVYLPLARHWYPGPSATVIGPETQLVIDGYPRSATTFAVYAFQLAQPAPVRLAHHLHAPAQLVAAARRGVPALAMVRSPHGAVCSQLIREPWLPVRDALAAYVRFYTRLMPYRSRLVVADFAEVTHDFGGVVRRLNAQFGTEYAEFEPTPANVRECVDLIRYRGTLSPTLLGFESGLVAADEVRRERATLARRASLARRSAPLRVREAWVPSTERDRDKAALEHRWRRPELAALRHRAERTYAEFLGEL
jgi:hypothetical protein